jgi:ABC-type thiamin/hydroxymethylpyrimidine transport system permease subunit
MSSTGYAVHVQGVTVTPEACESGAKFVCVWCMVAHTTLCPHITPKPGSQATSERYAHTGASHRALRMLLQPTAFIWVPEQC